MNSESKEPASLRLLSWVLTFVLVISVLSVLYSILAMLFLPTPSEYQGSFPSQEAPFLSREFWTRLKNGVLRHLALLNEHVNSASLIGIIGLAFTTLLVYTIREKLLEMREMEKTGKKGEIKIDEYVKWGFGAIISAIISTAAVIYGEPTKAYIILVLSISAFLMYILYPRFGILIVIKNWISSKIPENKKEENN